jgi:8-oxo-dGTP pyrophosphatase MutT (NUDIX family)
VPTDPDSASSPDSAASPGGGSSPGGDAASPGERTPIYNADPVASPEPDAETEPDADLIPAATVLLLRDADGADGAGGAADNGDAGIEVLMLRRNSKIAFGGMWVFPGGRVDEHEVIADDVVASARAAAAREVHEESGLVIEPSALVEWSYWVPPPMPSMNLKGPRRRFSTWFFATPAPVGDVAIDHGEIHEHRWLSPQEAMAQHRGREIELAPPTWISLHQLSVHRSVADAMAWAATAHSEEFRTKPIAKDPTTIAWAGDVAYVDGKADDPGPRHRLIMEPDGWQYLRD